MSGQYCLDANIFITAWNSSYPIKVFPFSHCVYDSGWEAAEAYFLEKSDSVTSFVKNDHLGFTILYNHKGVIRKYYPDFIIRLSNGEYMVIETKGKDSQQNKTKREHLNEWMKAVNEQGGFGKWHWDVSFEPSDIESKVKKCINNTPLPSVATA